ncbi:MAG TPA: nucleotide pyrophosphatase/phosphodiesterase family protein [Pirellulales bacterium]|nr:nucleotide pyrophosphatase/phosphodiesterase family protein [Pirellulales bacterium]
MPQPLVVINVVGLSCELVGPHTPNLKRLADDGFMRPMGTVLPAVTCTAQATLLTGLLPRDHGIVANGWYFRDLAEILFWRQSNHLIQGERIYQAGLRRDPGYTTAKLFWWYSMYADVDWSLTPRPSYPADGRKVFDSYSQPAELRDQLQDRLGVFPLLKLWGPGADITSSRWIAEAALQVLAEKRPTLTLIYLPHLDYCFQRRGPGDPHNAGELRAVDAEAGKLIEAARRNGAAVVVLSEYAIAAVDRPVHVNRLLRGAGFLAVRREPLGWETLDCGASRAFAVADHQVAHVYVRRAEDVPAVAALLERAEGVETVLDRRRQADIGINHERAGELVAVAAPGAWFTYYFWLDDALAPDYARTVDIHRKPGYDPVELFVDPALRLAKLHIARRLVQKKLGLRYLMDVIGLDATIVRGSHGRLPAPGREASEGPVFISSSRAIERDTVPMTAVKEMLLGLQFG